MRAAPEREGMTNSPVVPGDLPVPTLAVPDVLAVGPFATVPNVVTAVRTVLAVLIGATAVARADLGLLAVAYAVFWVGDIADGWTARRLGQETRAGAVFDIVCDRACTGILCVGLVASVPSVLPVVAVFVLSFMVLDSMLSMAFLCWPVLSPNYFFLVDRRVWQLNWSPLAKAANSAGVVGALALGADAVAFAIAVAVAAVKLWSARRVVRLLAAEGR
jgi:CDP-diacylglycerol--glycerol-3-phosphate 3-phosphatidyltransferase